MKAPRRTLLATTLAVAVLAADVLGTAPSPVGAADLAGQPVIVSVTAGVAFDGVVALVDDDDPGAVADHAALVEAWYADQLGRTATIAPGSYWPTLLDRGTDRVEVAKAIAGSVEGRRRLVKGAYARHLGRSPSNGEADYWGDLLGGGLRMFEVRAHLLASGEAYTRAGGAVGPWLAAVYDDLLGRQPSASESQHWAGQVAAHGRVPVARTIVASTEARRRLTAAIFSDLLDRSASGAELTTWTAVLAGSGERRLRAGLLATDEYFAALPSDYDATVTWPGGSTEPATLRRVDADTIAVEAEHIFGSVGTVEVEVDVERDGFEPAEVSSTAEVVLPTLERWSEHVLTHVLEAEPSPARRRIWAKKARLAGQGGRQGAATQLLLTGTARTAAVVEAYETHLGRTPGSGEAGYWAGIIAARPVEHLRALLLGSAEARNRSGGTDGGVVDRIWETVLGRTPTGDERQSAIERLALLGQSNLALEVLVSAEARHRLVVATYEYVLDRKPTAGERDATVARLLSGGLDERTLEAHLLGSAEVVARFPVHHGQVRLAPDGELLGVGR